jgi:hypothetical protein
MQPAATIKGVCPALSPRILRPLLLAANAVVTTHDSSRLHDELTAGLARQLRFTRARL